MEMGFIFLYVFWFMICIFFFFGGGAGISSQFRLNLGVLLDLDDSLNSPIFIAKFAP